MDCVNVGKLILDLRKENRMTQKQLADVMNISARPSQNGNVVWDVLMYPCSVNSLRY